jgi:hypothetical protein
VAPPSPPPGPFESEAEVRALPAVRQVYAAFRADPGVGRMTPGNLSILLGALAAADVDLGAHDHAIAGWVAGFEPQTVAVIAGWVQRAAEAGQADAASARLAALLAARTRDGPPLPDPGDRHRKTLASPETGTSADGILRPGEDGGRATREATP